MKENHSIFNMLYNNDPTPTSIGSGNFEYRTNKKVVRKKYVSPGSVLMLYFGNVESLSKCLLEFKKNDEVSALAICKVKDILNSFYTDNKVNAILEYNKYNIQTEEILMGRREIFCIKNKYVKDILTQHLEEYILMCIEDPVEYWDPNRNKKIRYRHRNITFPGGKRNNCDEKPAIAAQRELKEETGIEISLNEIMCLQHEQICYDYARCCIWKCRNNVPLWIFFAKKNVV